jgi:16S rRNA G1207 methylase RsmC
VKTLLVGYKAADLTPQLLGGDVTIHVLDIYHLHAIERVFPAAHVVCEPHLPKEHWDLIRFKTGPKLMAGELALDLLQEIHFLLRESGGKLELDYVGRERDRNDLVNKIRDAPERVRSFRAQWPASVPGGEKLQFVSYPGCFCHRRLDEGGLALAEVAARELKALFPNRDKSAAPLKILDMGCGCGLVGFLIASVVPNVELTLIDSHARAIEAAKENAARFNAPAEVVMTDDGIDRLKGVKHRFDVFVGNPPYYSDYRIAEVFLDAARKALKEGGLCYTVVKNDAGLKPVQEKFFPNVETLHRRGYCVLKSIEPPRAN